MSYSLRLFRVILKERYKSPTLELMVPAIIAGNLMIPAFLIRGGFQPYGLVLAFVPMINVSETAVLALALRNIIFVTGEHVYQGFISSFLTAPVTRTNFFLMVYLSDVLIPIALYWAIETLYSLATGILNPYTISLLIVFTGGYLFSVGVICLATLMLKSPGASVLTSMFVLSAIFVGGGVGEVGIIVSSKDMGLLYLASWMNPYVIAIAETVLPKSVGETLASALTVGTLVDFALGVALFLVSLTLFRRMDL
ncbi:MAG: hypothetical protein ACP5HQ_06990 [Thermoprotei archaeon]